MPHTFDANRARPIAVIGGGVTGLSAAHRLIQLDPSRPVVILERSNQPGGVLRTERHDGLLVERSADMFTTKDPAAWELAQEIGLGEQLISTNESGRRAFVVRRGRLHPVPAGFVLLRPTRWNDVLTSALLSPLGKLRLLAERLIPARNANGDESLASFAVRRMGREAFERLIQPLVGGIYTADPQKLSMAATMPEFVELEQRYGRLTFLPRRSLEPDQALQQTNPASWDHLASGARYSAFLAPRNGMQSLTDALAERLGPERVMLNRAVDRVVQTDASQWTIVYEDGAHDPTQYSGVIVAAPGPVASRLLRDLDADLSRRIGEIEYSGCAIAFMCYQKSALTRFEQGFGFVVPANERRRILAASFASEKFPGRAPADECLVRVFMGGALQAGLLRCADDELLRIAQDELQELLGAQGSPRWSSLARWEQAMPQYRVGHVERVDGIARRVARWPGLEIAGNAFHGVGVPACVRDGRRAAERLLRSLATSPERRPSRPDEALAARLDENQQA